MPLINIKDIDPSVLTPAEFRQYKACCAAIWCLRHADEIGYNQERGTHQNDQMKPPPYVPEVFDCVAFVTYCFRVSGCPDPFDGNYSVIGTTNTLYEHGVLVGGANIRQGMLRPGDVTFEGHNGNFFTHVCFYIGDGEVISHGTESGPLKRQFRGNAYAAPFQAVRRYAF